MPHSPLPPGPAFRRDRMLLRLEAEPFDVLVVGAGITGAGVALDAATRGLRTALIERDDFASGTSSKSSKLVHGGLRYLKDDPRLVREALRERHRLQRNAPHLVRVLPFMLPVLSGSSKDGAALVPRKVARALGSLMWMYDAAGGWRIGKLHKRLRANAALAHMPTLRSKRLAGAYVYYDAAADDARVVLTVCRTAAQHGAVVANGCSVVQFVHDANGKVAGAVVEADGRRITVAAKAVVNAAGVWADDVRALDEGAHPHSIRPAKGVHITIPWHKVRNDIAVIIPVPKDKRSLFVVPWGPLPDGTFQHSYVGTTDTDYDGPLTDPQCTGDDIQYILRALNASIDTEVAADDITGVWAGLRPLVKAASSVRTADLSRHHALHVSASGMISITGGKLTTYREMAEETVDAVVTTLGTKARCRTRRLPLLGAGTPAAPARSGAAGTPAAHLAGRYGTLAADVQALVDADPTLGQPLVPGLPYLRAEAVHAARHEMARTLDDVLTRRTRARLHDRAATLAAASAVAQLLAPELGWSAEQTAQQLAHFSTQCIAEIVAAITDASPTNPASEAGIA
ncbi:MAG: glycerol-3-phosphate dehydrogenase/oxidase [Actinomycetota bacterium]|nr:glycerol-3-phosphate dehydrogenase/oxidase [Actinomycetota bacterium]